MSPAKKSQSGFLQKLIIPLILLGLVYYFLRPADDDKTQTDKKDTETSQELQPPATSSVVTLAANRLGVAFDHPSAWGQVDAQNEKALVMMLDDTCIGSDCDSLYVQKIPNTDSNFAQLSATIKTMEVTKTRETTAFYEAKDNTPTNKKLYVYSGDAGAIYTFELAGKGTTSENFKKIITSFKENAPSMNTLTVGVPDATAATASDTTTTTTSIPAPGTTYKFQSCGDLTLYPQEEFYPDFVAKITKTRAYSIPLKLKMYGNVRITVGDIKNACYSTEGKSFIALVPPSSVENGTDFHVYKYDVTNKTLIEGKKNGTWADAFAPQQFGKRDGRVIKTKNTIKEGICVKDASFEYDYVDNAMSLKEVCSLCEGSAEKKCEKL